MFKSLVEYKIRLSLTHKSFLGYNLTNHFSHSIRHLQVWFLLCRKKAVSDYVGLVSLIIYTNLLMEEVSAGQFASRFHFLPTDGTVVRVLG